jgi:hypothetical protein
LRDHDEHDFRNPEPSKSPHHPDHDRSIHGSDIVARVRDILREPRHTCAAISGIPPSATRSGEISGQRISAYTAFRTRRPDPEETEMSTLKLIRVVAIVLAGSIAASATTTAWAKPHEERGFKTYLPGEGGCKDDLGFGWTARAVEMTA